MLLNDAEDAGVQFRQISAFNRFPVVLGWPNDESELITVWDKNLITEYARNKKLTPREAAHILMVDAPERKNLTLSNEYDDSRELNPPHA